jgi:hypothetical protein
MAAAILAGEHKARLVVGVAEEGSLYALGCPVIP